MRCLFCILLGVLVASTAYAVNTVVNSLDDSGASSLRQAIADAENGDAIAFAVTGTITLTSGELVITNSLMILGPGATNLVVSGNAASRVFRISDPGATVTISGLTIRDGKSADGIDGDQWTGGPALSPGGDGAGILSLGPLTLAECHITGNRTGRGGWSNFTHDPTGYDGTAGGSGGGVFCSNDLTAIACTFSGNSTGDGGAGGGVCAAAGTMATTLNSLFAQNRAGNGGARGTYEYGNPGSDGAAGAGLDLAGDWTSDGHNLLGTGEGCTGLANGVAGDLVGSTNAPIDALLYPLGNGGDPTPTRGLPTNSPAFDAGDDALLDPPYSLTTDQRGQPRKSYEHVDVGAFETLLQGPVLAAPGVTLESDPVNGLTLATLHAAVNPRGLGSGLVTEFGITTNYGYAVAQVSYPAGFAFVPTDIQITGLAPGLTYHFRMTATNAAANAECADQTFSTPEFFARGDADGDGAVDQDELNAVYANYWQSNPSVISNSFGLGETNVQLEIENALGWDLSVQASDDLLTWSNLPVRAVPVFRFEDSDATNHPSRTYRLLAP